MDRDAARQAPSAGAGATTAVDPSVAPRGSALFNRTDALILRRVPLIVTVLVFVLFFGDLASQILPGALRSANAVLKDLLLLLLLIPAVRRWRVVPRPLLASVGAVYALVLVAALHGPSVSAVILEFRSVYWGLLLLLGCVVLATDAVALALSRALVAAGSLAAVVALTTHALGADWLVRVARSPDGRIASNFFTYANDGRPRAFSPFIEPNMLGAAMVVVLLALVVYPPIAPRQRWVLAVLPVAALVATASRSAMSALVLGLVVVAVTSARGRAALASRRWRPWLVAAIGAGLIAMLAYGYYYASHTVDPSARFHLQTLMNGPKSLLEGWWGSGLGTVGPRATVAFPAATQVESGLLIVGLELGILGLLAFLAMLLALVAQLLSGLVATDQMVERGARWGLATLVAALPTIVLLAMIQSSSVVWCWWLVIGTSVGLTSAAARTPEAAVAVDAEPIGLASPHADDGVAL